MLPEHTKGETPQVFSTRFNKSRGVGSNLERLTSEADAMLLHESYQACNAIMGELGAASSTASSLALSIGAETKLDSPRRNHTDQARS